ncbi:single-stranded DNA binding protein [Halogeometricum luteum]|uniref:Single-stranded DNA binding protein n=1 Tax=Halogeometricum luteum TaxID=2950537 RepID=A0ABU2G670_9EURY|nr:single-stranded DNA binding protein [Halogeometricum sp. S3BR5-2]MDS0296281.1 single-stranded DNA binding protein [Halogeometricum sp. S3BR5-2]
MGAIEEVYDDLDTDVPFEEFEAAVNDKVEQMGGLADEETAAMLIAHELRDEEVEGVADIEPGMDDVKFLAKVMSIGELRTFERDGEDEDGRVVNVEVADETGRIRISLWDQMAEQALENLEVGQVLRVAGRPKDGYNGVEVSVDKVEPDSEAEIDVQTQDSYRVEDLSLGLSDVNLKGRVLSTDTVRTFDRDDGSEGRVANLTLGDPTGRIRVTLWDEKADLAEAFDAGVTVEVVDGYVRERDGDLELHVGNRGTVEELDEDVEYVPETTDIASLELDQTVDIAGGVIETDPKRTFDRDDGSEGQVRNVRVKDGTGDIRVAMWGEKADADIDLADYVVFTDVEIQDGWQDDLEASAGWRSTVSVMDEAPEGATGASAGAGADSDAGSGGRQSQSRGLDAFENGASSADASNGGDAGTKADATETDAEGAAVDAGDGAVEEFTGTVVQSGSPVVLDDGTETRSVETTESLQLGAEVTVRGPVREGRIDATDVKSVTR